MEQFLKTYWKQIAIVIGVIIVILIIYYYGKSSGSVGQVPLPPDDPNAPLTEAEKQKIRSIVLALHEDMDGYNFLGHNMQPYKDWLLLSNTGFVSVYNDFNRMYFSEGEGTLREWIENEQYNQWTLIDDVVIPKMNLWNLT